MVQRIGAGVLAMQAALALGCAPDMIETTRAPSSTPPISCGGLSFAGVAACKDYTGSAWTPASTLGECGTVIPGSAGGGTLSVGVPCAPDGGICTLKGGTPDAIDLHFYSTDPNILAGAKANCTAYLGGVWSGGTAPPPAGVLDPSVVAALQSDSTVTVTPNACVDDACLSGVISAKGAIVFAPSSGAKVGLVIYPGGMVEPRAYAVAARQIAAAGYLVALVPFPGQLAISDPMRGLGVTLSYPQITTWGVAGHSLGGVAASVWAKANPAGKLAAIALWASYPAPAMGASPAADLSQTTLKAVSLTADLDTVINWTSYTSTKPLLPPGTRFASIRGGNHAQFGYYGAQQGDGVAKVSRELQHELFVGATLQTLRRIGMPADKDRVNPIYESLPQRPTCAPAQKTIAHFRGVDLPLAKIGDTAYPYQGDFVSAKPGFPSAGATLVAVASHAHQAANDAVLDAPPISDGEVWCKMKSQEAMAAQYGWTPAGAEKTCRQINEQIFFDAQTVVWTKAPLTYLYYLLSGRWLTFANDYAATMGPEWLAHEVELKPTGASTTLQASKMETALTPPSPFAGMYYCKVWSLEAAVRFIVRAAARCQAADAGH